jgi:hypothetical protein
VKSQSETTITPFRSMSYLLAPVTAVHDSVISVDVMLKMISPSGPWSGAMALAVLVAVGVAATAATVAGVATTFAPLAAPGAEELCHQ